MFAEMNQEVDSIDRVMIDIEMSDLILTYRRSRTILLLQL